MWSGQVSAVTIYNTTQHYPQWVAAATDPCAAAFFDYEQTSTKPQEQWRLIIGLTNYFLHDTFVYTPDGLSDRWCTPTTPILEPWFDDCDGFAMRAALELAKGGIPKGNIFLATGLSYLGQINNLNWSPYHPQWRHSDHMVVLVVDDKNVWWVLDSSVKKEVRLLDAFGYNGYKARGIVNYYNYGPGTNTDVWAGWSRWTE